MASALLDGLGSLWMGRRSKTEISRKERRERGPGAAFQGSGLCSPGGPGKSPLPPGAVPLILLAVGLVVAAVHVARDAEDEGAVLFPDLDQGGVPRAASWLTAIGKGPTCRARSIGLLTTAAPLTHEGVEGRVRWIGLDRGVVHTDGGGEELKVEALVGRMVDNLKVVGVSGNAVKHEAVRHSPAILHVEDTAAASHPAVIFPCSYWFG